MVATDFNSTSHASMSSPTQMNKRPHFVKERASSQTNTVFSHRDSATVASHDLVSSQKFISLPITETIKPYRAMRHARLKSAVPPGSR